MADRANRLTQPPPPERYRRRLRTAYETLYGRAADIWSDEAAMARVGHQFAAWIGEPPKRILDVGAGRGRDARLYASLGHDVTAVDLMPLRDDVTEQATRGNLRFVQCDIRDLTCNNGFDVICDNGCYHHEHPAEAADYLAHLARLLRGRSGRLCIAVFAAKQQKGDLAPMPDGRFRRAYTADELTAELAAAGFRTDAHRKFVRHRPDLAYLAMTAIPDPRGS
ncbi:class I SAM-dependent methyltransferase [Stappia stellulata]|uniref:class I SAM-dependent methyltransferase n=1 Tax=Stappia stellulata TaxID=71235 RepID=UPI001CD69965|nr:class I SAM-dependent methyltransferase [Stappia stellulata]MCA1242676.1 class I SAM-dependent methyltransferase [Stappia stellulata]